MNNLEELIDSKNKETKDLMYENLIFEDNENDIFEEKDLKDLKSFNEKGIDLTKKKKSFLKTEKDVFNKMLEIEADLDFKEQEYELNENQSNYNPKTNLNNKEKDNKEKTNKIIENAFLNFKEKANEKLGKDKKEEEKRLKIIEEKKKVLLPIRNLFNRFREMGLMVKNSNLNISSPSSNKEIIKNDESNDEVLFKFYKKYTIGGEAPGLDFVIKHPCLITITVLNKKIVKDKNTNEIIEKDYEIRINVEDTKCPYVDLIRKDFKTNEAACMALSTFFALNAEKIINPSALEE